MSIKEVKSEYCISLKRKVEELEKEYKINVTNFFNIEIQKLFSQFPSLTEISWLQYTPYFCDGDVCEFGRNDFEFNGHSVYSLTRGKKTKTQANVQDIEERLATALKEKTQAINNEDYIKANSLKTNIEWLKDELQSVKKELATDMTSLAEAAIESKNRLECFSDNIYLLLFGDHVSVTITRDGIKIEQYNHN